MKEQRFEILDTYQDFSDYWADACSEPIDKQVHLWQTLYMGKYPELLDKQVQCYKNENIEWRDMAGKVFPALPVRLPIMQAARNNILSSYPSICSRASEKLGFGFDIVGVVYVGIGCGAGWAATYGGQPAVLLGLENIAKEKWHTKARLQGLISHEIGHLVHMRWRDDWGESFEEKVRDPLFLLYAEGFAQRCEHLIIGKENWHMGPNKEWLAWCAQKKGWLAAEFLNRLSRNESVNDFFGSWFNIRGKKQTGYFLGHDFITEIEKMYSLREISLLRVEDMRKLALNYLDSTSTG